jgi:hypothetical protein
MSGWFSVKRGITSHAIFKGKPERLAIWLWLLDNACWQDTQHDINGKIVTVPRGSVAVSERRIADEVGVGRQVVRTFFALLQSQSMINPCLTHGRTIVSLCNWEKYQAQQPKPNPPVNPRLTQSQPIKEQLNNSVSKDTDASVINDPSKMVWGAGVSLLVSSGMAQAKARSMVGKWRKDHDDAALIVAMSAAQREGAIDPVAFIEKALQHRAKAEKVEPKDGDIRNTPQGWKKYERSLGWFNLHPDEVKMMGLE